MSTFEGSYKSLLQGVSQQQPEFRLDGQLAAQVNMMSDAATGLRRRPGTQMVSQVASGSAVATKYMGMLVEIAGQQVHVFVDCVTGYVTVKNMALTTLVTLTGPAAYLTASDISSIHTSVVGDRLYICNTEKKPHTVIAYAATPRFSEGGFIWIKAGAFSTTYAVKIDRPSGGAVYLSYATPDGSTAGDAAVSTPAYIAQQLYTQIGTFAPWLTATYGTGTNTVFFLYTAELTVTSSTGDSKIGTSNNSYVTSIGELPPSLPLAALNYTIAVGSTTLPTYYKWTPTPYAAWLECAAPEIAITDPLHGEILRIEDMPVRIGYSTATGWFSEVNYDGLALGTVHLYPPRVAGDEVSSPNPAFLTHGITGISSYAGRLVILAGAYVCMSAVGNHTQFYRSTVTDIIDSDPIEVGAVSNSAAAYSHALQFNKDLLVFSSGSQAVIPSLTGALTPRNTTIFITSSYPCLTRTAPVVVGRTLMYISPRSAVSYGVLEMAPSAATEAQYTSNDATGHIPNYTPSDCRFIAASGVSGIAVFGGINKRELLVHEYLWSGDTKVQQAWHTWIFPADIAWAYFVQGKLHIVFIQNGYIVIATLDPKGIRDTGTIQYPYLDMYSQGTVAANHVTLNTWLYGLVPAALTTAQVTQYSGDLRGELVGVTYSGGATLTTGPSYPSGSVYVGLPFVSSFTPTPPVLKDRNEIVVSTNKLTLLRYVINTANAPEFGVSIADHTNRSSPVVLDSGTLYWHSEELVLGQRRTPEDASTVIPCRVDAPSSTVNFYSTGPGEFNIKTLEYIGRSVPKIKRG